VNALIKTATKIRKKSKPELDHILRIVVGRLKEKDIEPGKIPSCLETILYNILLRPAITYQELNRKMQSIGWQNFEIDEHTLNLVKLIPCQSETAPAHGCS